ncbi:hypothetical protein [Bartonella koehlerae]|uniref:Uncharacterized protein n=1 Tax=Bartonella koehlerae C-29 TaxID=1134510 RepID=A0A067W975_9HYPH|nr:hypothetical protein [Bartonella koehlerae]KEC56550.1 hypothetical protein O9A_00044 [Bartonella koehlerae C-29]
MVIVGLGRMLWFIGEVSVDGNATVSGYARIYDSVYDNAKLSGYVKV